ncbi:hypothetical protein [Cohnella sp. 56]|uniref:hypothetical protein n=1 Tax=Cohnella sp. 56 TaxID=3113722 RepID=UPI0030E87875
MLIYLAIFGSIALGAVAQILMKYGSNGLAGISLFLNPYVIAGLFVYGLSSILWILSLPKVQLSLAYPMVSLGYVLVFVLSYFIFHDTISLMRMVGLGVIVVGVLIIAKS